MGEAVGGRNALDILGDSARLALAEAGLTIQD
ncbi:MAG: hypothetical protein VW985_09105, partial [Gammaproteobacteria bacterium]